MIALKILGCLLLLFVAYVVGRAVGILTGIGPYPMEALAIALALGAIAWRTWRRRRDRATA